MGNPYHVACCIHIFCFFPHFFKRYSTILYLLTVYITFIPVLTPVMLHYTGWHTKCHTIDCARNTFLLLQKHLASGTELILIGWKIVPNEEHVQRDHRFASQPLANEPLP